MWPDPFASRTPASGRSLRSTAVSSRDPTPSRGTCPVGMNENAKTVSDKVTWDDKVALTAKGACGKKWERAAARASVGTSYAGRPETIPLVRAEGDQPAARKVRQGRQRVGQRLEVRHPRTPSRCSYSRRRRPQRCDRGAVDIPDDESRARRSHKGIPTDSTRPHEVPAADSRVGRQLLRADDMGRTEIGVYLRRRGSGVGRIIGEHGFRPAPNEIPKASITPADTTLWSQIWLLRSHILFSTDQGTARIC